LTLTDNSKIIFNAKDKAEGMRMIAAAKTLIKPDKIDPKLPIKTNERLAAGVFEQRNVKLWEIHYYSKGWKKSVRPDWKKRI
jgi:hypothetical protein